MLDRLRSVLDWRREAGRAALAGALAASTLIGAGCGFLAQVALARSLGPGRLAEVVTLLAVTNVLVPLALFGSGGGIVLQGSATGRVSRRLLRGVWSAVGVSALAISFVGVGWIVLTRPAGLDWRIALLVVPLVVGGASGLLADARFLAEGPRVAVLFWHALPNVLRLGAVAVWLIGEPAAATAALALAVAATLLFFASLVVSWPAFTRRDDAEGPFHWGGWLRTCLPFAASTVLYGVFVHMGVLVTAYVAPVASAGILGVALSVYLLTHVLASALSHRLLMPRFVAWTANDAARVPSMFRYLSLRMGLLGVALAVSAIVVAPWAIPLVFGPGLRPAVLVTQVLFAAAPLKFLSSTAGALVATSRAPHAKPAVEAGAVAVMVVAAVLLVPPMGAVGAAVAFAAAEGALLVGLWWAGRRWALRPAA